MGYENENDEPMILDIETAGRPDITPEPVEAPSNYRDPVKIEEYKRDKMETQVSRAALDVYLNQIICIGVWTASQGFNIVVAKTLAEEKTALAALAVLVSNNGHRRRVITFNGTSFDLGNLMVRASYHALVGFPVFELAPDYRAGVNDLMQICTYFGKFPRHSLDFYCDFYGLDAPASDEVKALSGSDIPRLFAEGRFDLIADHCRHDVHKTLLLARRRGVMP